MKSDKIEIEKEKFDINLKFYFFLKYLVKSKLSDNQSNALLKIYILKMPHEMALSQLIEYAENKIKLGSIKQKLLLETLSEIDSELSLKLFVFSLKLYLVKDLLLQEAKI